MVANHCMQAHEQAGWLDAARRAMDIEARAIAQAARRLDGNLSRAVEMILAHPGKLVVTGLGKSGHVARKIVATLCSTGTPAVFLHASEASHGDLGIYSPGDPTLMVSKSGNTNELCQLIPFLRELPSRASAFSAIRILAAGCRNGRRAGCIGRARSRPGQSGPHRQRHRCARAGPCSGHRAHGRPQLQSRRVWTLSSRRPFGTQPALDRRTVLHGPAKSL